MKILVLGNINSGKSHLADILAARLPHYTVIQLDAYRKAYSDGSMEGEKDATSRFIQDSIHTEHAVVECTGLGNIAVELQAKLPPKSYLVLVMGTPLSMCLDRVDMQKFASIPYPYHQEDIRDTIKRLDAEIQSGSLQKLWEKQALFMQTIRDESDLDWEVLYRYEKVADVIGVLQKRKEIKEIVLFGSLARKQFSAHSDADIMVTTQMTPSQLSDALMRLPKVTFGDVLGDKVTIYFGTFLIEILVQKNICDNACYYANSCITDVAFSMVKGDETTLVSLTQIRDAWVVDRDALIQSTVKRLVYFVLSLDTITVQNQYKFFFHANIVVHEIVRLKKLLDGEVRYNYLPKNSDGIFQELAMEKCVFGYGDDMQAYGRRIRRYVARLLTGVAGMDKYVRVLEERGKQQNGCA